MLIHLLADVINPQQGQENRDPLPNPWSAGGEGGNSENRTSTGGTAGSKAGTAGSKALTPGGGGIFNSPAMQSVMQQMIENPQMIQNMLAAPYTQSMLQALTENPAMASSVLGSNPFLASNPELQVCFVTVDIQRC